MISDSVQTAIAPCISAVVKIATESEIIRFFFYPGPIRVLSGFYPGVSDRPKNHIISDSVQIIATSIALCISAVVKFATESEIIRFFFYPGPIRVLSGFYPGVADWKWDRTTFIGCSIIWLSFVLKYSEWSIITAFQVFYRYRKMDSWMDRLKSKDFYWRAIHVLRDRWAKVVTSEGQYFE